MSEPWVVQYLECSDEGEALLQTVMVPANCEVISTTEPIELDAALKIAREIIE